MEGITFEHITSHFEHSEGGYFVAIFVHLAVPAGEDPTTYMTAPRIAAVLHALEEQDVLDVIQKGAPSLDEGEPYHFLARPLSLDPPDPTSGGTEADTYDSTPPGS